MSLTRHFRPLAENIPPESSQREIRTSCREDAGAWAGCADRDGRAPLYRSSFIPGLHDVCMVFEKA